MKPIVRSFGMFVRQIANDGMLWGVGLAPLLLGVMIRFGVPYVETVLSGYLPGNILVPYYQLFDLVLFLMTPYMFCFASAMVMLAERDENIAQYLAITPLGKKGYVFSRLYVPVLLSVPASIMVMLYFSLTVWPTRHLLEGAILMGLLSTVVALLVVSISRNRVEGVAVGKLSGLLILGLVVPYFIESGFQYLVCFMPSFWIARYFLDGNILFLLSALVTSLVWIALLFRKFSTKLF
ncbi:MAG: hypothetical protein CVV46_09625 [Spirochaetae bacterium HGW-Spirochaetae-2]|jgi:fluoroquinolone transport system permease protein|nr:MAG: hypothetical protein CVV46_09625 [Spirochaetae bacterium HGW-Spirochaetae-2]